MNQTESRCKAEGSGVGILSETRPATSARSAAFAQGEPKLQLRAYLTAPDRMAVVGVRCAFNRRIRLSRPAKNLRQGRKSLSLSSCEIAVYG